MARATESSAAGAGAADVMPESGAQRPAASEEQAARPEMPQGMVGRSMRPPSPQGVPSAVEEEDKVEEIEREGSRTQTVCIFHKRGEEIVVVEEEDTTREVKRLRSTLCIAMKQIELIKRMEPLIEENEKLREAMKLMEKNVQRAQCERDLAESNTTNLEYQKGILSEQLKIISEQLGCTSEQQESSSKQLEHTSGQLKSVSEQKKEYRRRTKA
ncbi:uncharacterized protein [Miscanthus floridulus]|uniref:uncharacterized protein n=1 Tax=Miscanthus floridulus TaxID=154761 RepID=UPI003457C304